MNHLFQFLRSEDINGVGPTLLRGSLLAILTGFFLFFIVPMLCMWLLPFLGEAAR